MDHGKESEVWDVDGNHYSDLTAGNAVCSTGHSPPKVVEAVQKQAEKFLHISSDFYHPTWIEFSEQLAKTAPFKEPAKALRDRIVMDSFERWLLPFSYGDSTISFCPAMSISREEMDEALGIFEASITEVEKEGIN